MRVPLLLIAMPMLLIGFFGVFVSPETVMQYVEQTPWLEPLRIRLATVVPMIVGNRSFGTVALSCVLILVLKQIGDYFDKPLRR
jgi:hypothetical protein